ncbi:MAG: glycosyltransferase family 4 protein [Planctomycetes bacterium]|nr:glycosyltransferase family 4 protein [Planctomycetota bacterium]
MRIAIYTSDLVEENRHLMPWRMVLEIGRAACEAGHQARVLSGRRHPAGDRWAYGRCLVEEIEKPYSAKSRDSFQQAIEREGIEVLFWPVAWCNARRQGALLGKTLAPIVWYVPGACYLPGPAIRALPDLGVRSAFPFLLQALYPKRRLVKRLRGPAASLMITASLFNRSAVCRAGWPAEDVFVVPPGKPMDRASVNGQEPTVFNTVRSRLRGRPFYLYLGPPTRIRGIRQLFEAFDLLARRRADVCLVCLFRSDPQTDVAAARRMVEDRLHLERIFCVWESVKRVDLDAFLAVCHAVVLPFLLVPAEIPLALIEAAGHAKPVVTTGPGGTGDFVRDLGLAVPAGRSHALADAMRRLLEDEQLYADKRAAARRMYAAHPTWEEVAQTWLSIAARAIQRAAQADPASVF